MNIEQIEYISAIMPLTGYGFYITRKSLDAGKESKKSLETRLNKIVEEEKEKIIPIYNTHGKIVQKNKKGYFIDILK